MKNTKRIKYSINASVIVIGAIVAAILLNSLLIAFDSKISLEIDLTKEEFYKLSEDTKRVIDEIDEETKIVVLYDGSMYKETENDSATGMTTANKAMFETKEEDSYLMSILSLLEKYSDRNEKIIVETVDYYTDPAPLWQEYYDPFIKFNETGSVPYYGMMFIRGDKYEIADYQSYSVEVYNKEEGKIELESSIENVVTNKLAALSDTKQKISRLLYTQGHGEKVNVSIAELLQKNSYPASYINLAENDIPDENVIMVIDSPATDFTAEEIEKIDTYLRNGGNLQVYFNPLLSNDELPKLESYLADEWGIVRNHGVINDVGSAVESNEDTASTYGVIAIGRLAPHEIVSSVSKAGLRVMYSSSNALDIRPDTESALKVEKVIETSADAVLKTVETAKEPATAGDEKGTYNVVLAATKDYYSINDEKFTGKVLVCGSSYTMDLLPLQSNCANSDLLLNSFEWMNGGVSDINIESKSFPSGALVITNAAKWICFGALVVAIPVIVLAIGIVVFTKRRYK